VPLARNRRTSEGCPGVALRATRGTAIISLTPYAWPNARIPPIEGTFRFNLRKALGGLSVGWLWDVFYFLEVLA
jgi:hypothetical protein